MPVATVAATVLATWFGAGKSPLAPGTVGSVATLPLHLLLRRLGPGAYALTTLGLYAVGVWAAQREAERLEVSDPSSVVIDEVVGTLLALGLAGGGLVRGALALGLFRVLDIKKPGLIGRAEHAQPEGVGIMLDDVLAGALAGAAVRVLTRR